jgi:hypothetical protein
MIIVDTSVLIDYLKGRRNRQVLLLDDILEKKIPYGINDYIYQEVLQGAGDINEYERLKEYFETIPFYSLLHGRESFEKAAFLYFTCRRSGITVRSTIDLLIAETALENGLYILHKDGDFDNMSKAVPELKIYN